MIIIIGVTSYISASDTVLQRFLFLFVDLVSTRAEIRGTIMPNLVQKDNKNPNNPEQHAN